MSTKLLEFSSTTEALYSIVLPIFAFHESSLAVLDQLVTSSIFFYYKVHFTSNRELSSFSFFLCFVYLLFLRAVWKTSQSSVLFWLSYFDFSSADSKLSGLRERELF